MCSYLIVIAIHCVKEGISSDSHFSILGYDVTFIALALQIFTLCASSPLKMFKNIFLQLCMYKHEYAIIYINLFT